MTVTQCKYGMRYSKASCCSLVGIIIYPVFICSGPQKGHRGGKITCLIRLPLTGATIVACSPDMMLDRNALHYASFSTDASLKQMPFPYTA